MKSSQFRGKANKSFLKGPQNRGRGQDQNEHRGKAKLFKGSQKTGRGDQNDTNSQCPKFDQITFREQIQAALTKAEIHFLVELILSKGHKIKRITRSLKGEDVQKFKEITKKIPLEQEHFRWMCNMMVEVTCAVLVLSPTIGPVSLETCIKKSALDEFPTIARHVACASLIPHSFKFRAKALQVIMMVNMMFSERIQNPEWKSMLSHEKFRYMFDSLRKTFESTILNEHDRWELCRKYGIVTWYYELTEPWLKAVVVANRYLNENYRYELLTMIRRRRYN